jgi:hypothetical protein
MAISARLSRTLHQRLGDEAGEDLVNWMEHMEATRSEWRDIMEVYSARIDSRFAEQQTRMDAGFAQLEAKLEAKFERRFSDLLKWSFVFWCGAVAAIAALAGVLK